MVKRNRAARTAMLNRLHSAAPRKEPAKPFQDDTHVTTIVETRENACRSDDTDGFLSLDVIENRQAVQRRR